MQPNSRKFEFQEEEVQSAASNYAQWGIYGGFM